MRFSQIVEVLQGTVVHKGEDFDGKEISHVVTCDLMSDLLVTDEDEILLITSLPSDQVARTADMVGARGIVLVNGKAPQPALMDLVKEMNLTLILSAETSFTASWKIGRVLHGS